MANTQKKARKARTDSVKAQSEMAKRLETAIEPPIDLTDNERQIFDSFIAGLPQESWEAHQVRMAANLARLECYLERLITEVSLEGPVVVNERGTPVANPKQSAMTTTMSTVKMIRSALGLNASQRGVSATSTRQQKEAEKQAKKAIDTAKGGGLLA